MSNEYRIGETVRLTGTFSNSSGVLGDPTTVALRYEDPSGNLTTLIYGTDAEVTKSGTGIYYANIVTDEVGKWYYNWISTGPGWSNSDEGSFTCVATVVDGVHAINAFSSRDAFSILLKRNPWMSQRVVQEPVVGLLDGVNKSFNLASPPAMAPSVSFIKSDGSVAYPSWIDFDSGAVLFSSAPSVSVYASYTHSLLSNTDAYGLFEEGFALMESMWGRGYFLVTTGDVKAISSSASTVVDPVILTSTFSVRVQQTALVVDCMYYAWVQSALAEATYNAMAVREQRASGLQIDRTRQPDAFKSMIEIAEKRLSASLIAALVDAGEEDDAYEGGAIGAIRSNWNAVNSWWQESQGGIYAPA